MSPGDDELAALAAANDPAAFGHLVSRHHAVVRGFVRRLSRDEAAADDIAQEAFLTAYQKIGLYRGPGRLRSWLLSIAYREFLAYRRKQKRRALLLDLFAPTRDQPPGTRPDGAAQEGATPYLEDEVMDSMELTRALDRLNGAERDALLLCDVYGFSQTETAKLMNAPLGTVKSYVKRGRKRLRGMLASPAVAAEA